MKGKIYLKKKNLDLSTQSGISRSQAILYFLGLQTLRRIRQIFTVSGYSLSREKIIKPFSPNILYQKNNWQIARI